MSVNTVLCQDHNCLCLNGFTAKLVSLFVQEVRRKNALERLWCFSVCAAPVTFVFCVHTTFSIEVNFCSFAIENIHHTKHVAFLNKRLIKITNSLKYKLVLYGQRPENENGYIKQRFWIIDKSRPQKHYEILSLIISFRCCGMHIYISCLSLCQVSIKSYEQLRMPCIVMVFTII